MKRGGCRPQVAGLNLTLNNVLDGVYQVCWFDPQTGEEVSASAVTAKNGTLIVPVPEFQRDLAAKIGP
jgi:hypothetical protein